MIHWRPRSAEETPAKNRQVVPKSKAPSTKQARQQALGGVDRRSRAAPRTSSKHHSRATLRTVHFLTVKGGELE